MAESRSCSTSELYTHKGLNPRASSALHAERQSWNRHGLMYAMYDIRQCEDRLKEMRFLLSGPRKVKALQSRRV